MARTTTPTIRTTIGRDEVFDRVALSKALGLNATTLSREVRLGHLPCYRRGKRDYFLGRDVLRWLRAGRRNVSPVLKAVPEPAVSA